jgi:outer membrane receptor protein involved in Fe transport
MLQEFIFTASRGEGIKRADAPLAISIISTKNLKDTRATSAEQLLNKISGVNMVTLGNEQHQMSIRQPMTTKSLFLYLEDGIPVRTTGLYNHNALLEMNLAATRTIEVVKGPSSALYGSEAIGGVVNFITLAPTEQPSLKLALQGNNIGYKRGDFSSTFTTGKLGFAISGYYADKRNGFLDYTDFHKGIFTARMDYRFTDRTSFSNSATWLNYYSDMTGTIDSSMFATHTFKNQQTFTYRKVKAFRYRSTLSHQWNNQANSSLSVIYRSNSIGQNPAYRIKDDYRRQGNVYVGNKELAHGEINESSFNSYSVVAQHRQQLSWKRAVIIAGVSTDLSPSDYIAEYIRINKDTLASKYVSYQAPDSLLSNYSTRLDNIAGFVHLELSPVDQLRVVVSLRYDRFRYDYNNHLDGSAYSGAPDAVNRFSRLSPKIGLTYSFTPRVGVYANYSQGFVPPQVTEMYNGVKVPQLSPAVYDNYEAGAWFNSVNGKLSADLSIYRLEGKNAVISVKLDDGSFANQNAGRTLHKGIEAGLKYNPWGDLSLRFSGAYNNHVFVDYVEKGVDFNGNEMNNAPNWLYNTEIICRPSFLPGFRIGAEWQHVGSYFTDPANTDRYEGYDVLNLRAGYSFRSFDLWLNVLNATDTYYSVITSKSNFGYSYQLAEPVSFNVGIAYDFSPLFKHRK